MIYEERLDLLVDNIKRAKLNNEEIGMLHGVLKLSEERNNFEKQYNNRKDAILKNKESVE